MRYWLMKTEPDVFSLDDLLNRTEEFWDGVRNYQARNFMRDDMRVGDKVLFYHSNANPSGIAGICEIVKEALPDVSALNAKSEYYDASSTKENIKWFAVTVGKGKPFKRFLSLQELKVQPELKDMLVIKKGQRLSIQPVTKDEWTFICKLGGGFSND